MDIPRASASLAAVAQGRGVAFVDLSPGMADDRGDLLPAYSSGDGLQLSPEGYDRLCRLLAGRVGELVPIPDLH